MVSFATGGEFVLVASDSLISVDPDGEYILVDLPHRAMAVHSLSGSISQVAHRVATGRHHALGPEGKIVIELPDTVPTAPMALRAYNVDDERPLWSVPISALNGLTKLTSTNWVLAPIDGAVHIFDILDGRHIGEVPLCFGKQSNVRLALSPDESILLVDANEARHGRSVGDQCVTAWSLDTGKKLAVLHHGPHEFVDWALIDNNAPISWSHREDAYAVFSISDREGATLIPPEGWKTKPSGVCIDPSKAELTIINEDGGRAWTLEDCSTWVSQRIRRSEDPILSNTTTRAVGKTIWGELFFLAAGEAKTSSRPREDSSRCAK